MAYTPLTVASTTPERVKSVIRSLENHYFSDVHTMLRLPLPEQQLTAGCNFAIAQVLAAVISGVSVTLHREEGRSGTRFAKLLESHYPWAIEPGNKVTPKEGARILYVPIRNPLTHDLGLNLNSRKHGRKIIVKRSLLRNTSQVVGFEFGFQAGCSAGTSVMPSFWARWAS